MLRTVAGLLLLVLWELAALRLGTEFVARPTGIVEVAPEVLATEKFWVDAWETIGAVIGGVLIGAVAGVILGLAMGRIQLVRWFFTTYVSALYTLPMVAVVPLMTIWLGYTSETRLVAVALSAFLPIVVTTADGSRSIPKEYLDVARTFRAKMHNIWFGIALRNATPYLIAGLQLAIARALVTAVAVEFLAGVPGLGYSILQQTQLPAEPGLRRRDPPDRVRRRHPRRPHPLPPPILPGTAADAATSSLRRAGASTPSGRDAGPHREGDRVPQIETAGAHHRETTPEGIFIEWDVPIEMDDGSVLRADVYRPAEDGRFPVIMTYGPYGKGLPFQEGYKTSWDIMARNHPDVTAGSTNRFQNWEVVDPEKWVPEGYVCIRVDSRGAGRSPGKMDLWSARETRDFYECIEWAGTQEWSTGKVGLNGISYYAMNQWQVAAQQPPHLAAICVWEAPPTGTAT